MAGPAVAAGAGAAGGAAAGGNPLRRIIIGIIIGIAVLLLLGGSVCTFGNPIGRPAPTPTTVGCTSTVEVKQLVFGALQSTNDECHLINPDRITPETVMILGNRNSVGVLEAKDIRGRLIGPGNSYAFALGDDGRGMYCDLRGKMSEGRRPSTMPLGWQPCDGMALPVSTGVAQATAVQVAISATEAARANATATMVAVSTQVRKDYELTATAQAATSTAQADALWKEATATTRSVQSTATAYAEAMDKAVKATMSALPTTTPQPTITPVPTMAPQPTAVPVPTSTPLVMGPPAPAATQDCHVSVNTQGQLSYSGNCPQFTGPLATKVAKP